MSKVLLDEGMYLLELADNDVLVWTTRYYEKDEKKGMQDLNMLIENMDDLFNKEPNKHYSALVDVRPVFDQVLNLPQAATQAFSKLLKHPQIKNAAVLGPNIYLAKMVEMLSRFTEKWRKIRIFKDKEEALNWLKDEA